MTNLSQTIQTKLTRTRERPCLWTWRRLHQKTRALWTSNPPALRGEDTPSSLPPVLHGGD